MTTDINPSTGAARKPDVNIQTGSGGTVYGLGLIGAWVYYIGRADTARERVAGFFKGVFWPAFVVYAVLDYLNRER